MEINDFVTLKEEDIQKGYILHKGCKIYFKHVQTWLCYEGERKLGIINGIETPLFY